MAACAALMDDDFVSWGKGSGSQQKIRPMQRFEIMLKYGAFRDYSRRREA
jgi:hypothetical protein